MSQRRLGDDHGHWLLAGATGFLGRRVADELARRGIRFVGTCQNGAAGVPRGYLRYKFPHDEWPFGLQGTATDYAIICARLTKTDLCDEQTYTAMLDRLLTSIRRGMSDAPTSKMVYVSTDAVFSGRKGRYIETDPPDPTSAYGRRQHLAEQAIQALDIPYLIVRPSFIVDLQAPDEDKRLSRLLSKVRAGDPIRADSNVFKSPVNARSLAQLIVENTLSDRTGILHAAADRKSVYEFFSDSLTALGLEGKRGLIISEVNPKPEDTSLSSRFEGHR